jgi:hydroxyacylglutathione hydrolase
MLLHKSTKLTNDFYFYSWIGGGNNCNSSLLVHALEGEKPHVLVDPGHLGDELGEPCFDSLVSAMEKDGFRLADIGLVVCTHCHPDHFEAVDAVVDSGAAMAISREEDDFLQGRGKMFFSSFNSSLPRARPSFYLEDGDSNLGGRSTRTIQTLLTPGHTPGSICLYLAEDKILVSGDVVFYASVGRTDFPGGNSDLLFRSIDRLSQLDVECLAPGHSTGMGNAIRGKKEVQHNFQIVKKMFF